MFIIYYYSTKPEEKIHSMKAGHLQKVLQKKSKFKKFFITNFYLKQRLSQRGTFIRI